MSTPEMQDEKMKLTGVGVGGSGGVKEGKVQKSIISDLGHLLTMEGPEKCADIAADWLGKWHEQFQAAEKKAQQERSIKSERGGLVVSKEWQERARTWMEETSKRVKGKL